MISLSKKRAKGHFGWRSLATQFDRILKIKGGKKTQCRDCAQDGEGTWIQVAVTIAAVAEPLSLDKDRLSARFFITCSLTNAQSLEKTYPVTTGEVRP